MLEYSVVVLWDSIVSNVQVAYLVLFRRGDSLRSQFVTVPLDLQTPEAITVLAGTITMTPGTVSADLAADGSAILVHCLETLDPEGTVRQIKSRYERRLREIFEYRKCLLDRPCGHQRVRAAQPVAPGDGARCPRPGARSRHPGHQRHRPRTVIGVWFGSTMYFEAALLFAMVGFLSTAAFCKYLLRGNIIE